MDRRGGKQKEERERSFDPLRVDKRRRKGFVFCCEKREEIGWNPCGNSLVKFLGVLLCRLFSFSSSCGFVLVAKVDHEYCNHVLRFHKWKYFLIDDHVILFLLIILPMVCILLMVMLALC